MKFPDDVFEDNLPFDRMLSFSYHPDHTPSLPLDLGQRRHVLQEKPGAFGLKVSTVFLRAVSVKLWQAFLGLTSFKYRNETIKAKLVKCLNGI